MFKIEKLKLLAVASVSIFLFSACSSKNTKVQEYNKPALYWYQQMLDEISMADLEAADDTYISLESEHRNSPLLPTATLILVNAHMDEEEYELANFYLDEYIKRYGMSKNIEYVRYLKIKANFLGLKYALRDQKLIEDTIIQISDFKVKYPKSSYMPLVDTINARLFMAKASIDKSIADLYRKKGKEKAAEIYEQRVKESWVNPSEINPVEVPFYREIFE